MQRSQRSKRAQVAHASVSRLTVSATPPCLPDQLYVPRLPGIPSDYPYHPDAFHLAFEDVWLVSQPGLFAIGQCLVKCSASTAHADVGASPLSPHRGMVAELQCLAACLARAELTCLLPCLFAPQTTRDGLRLHA